MIWRWLLSEVVVALHCEQIAVHGGSLGVRDAGLLSSALARPQNQVAYGDPSVFDLAAAYAYGIIRNHPFVDGNKRTGFLAAYVFLDMNGWELMAPEDEAVTSVLALVTGEMTETDFSCWLKTNSVAHECRNNV